MIQWKSLYNTCIKREVLVTTWADGKADNGYTFKHQHDKNVWFGILVFFPTIQNFFSLDGLSNWQSKIFWGVITLLLDIWSGTGGFCRTLSRWGLSRRNNPVSVALHYWYVADRDWMELLCSSIDRNQFGWAKMIVDLTLSQINSKN